MIIYRLEFYDHYYHDIKIGPGFSLTDVLFSWGCWLDQQPWVIKIGRFVDGVFKTECVVGRSAPFFKEHA
jgi:hypothetical protein